MCPVVRTRSGPDPDAVGTRRRFAGRGEAAGDLRRPGRALGRRLCRVCRRWPSCSPHRSAPACRARARSTRPIPWHWAPAATACRARCRTSLNAPTSSFGIGCSFSETSFGVAIPKGKTIIHATGDAVDFNKGVITQCALLGDAQLTLLALIEACKARIPAPRDPGAVAAEIKAVEAEWMKVMAAQAHLHRCALEPLSRAVGPAAYSRRRQHHHHP